MTDKLPRATVPVTLGCSCLRHPSPLNTLTSQPSGRLSIHRVRLLERAQRTSVRYAFIPGTPSIPRPFGDWYVGNRPAPMTHPAPRALALRLVAPTRETRASAGYLLGLKVRNVTRESFGG